MGDSVWEYRTNYRQLKMWPRFTKSCTALEDIIGITMALAIGWEENHQRGCLVPRSEGSPWEDGEVL